MVRSSHGDAGISFSKGISICYFTIIATILAVRWKMSFMNLQIQSAFPKSLKLPKPKATKTHVFFKLEKHAKQVNTISPGL